ncbi:hypothetical protein BpHYR1_004889 [Brachionus plicatilis]|uniref:Uncharacterized protein n=1 Tax=Brachionus plicatilis TaxID=10195 RepID=A0A3M7RQQ6_BRAPC|nr:hypothetical protein BpHYR1_004889 [Brachionus plicatilis]
MLYSSSLIEYSSVIELIIEQLDLIKIIFEKKYSNLSQIDSWVHEAANSSSKADISDNLFYDKIKKYKQFWKSVQTDIDPELLVGKTLLKFSINNPMDSIEVQDENGEKIRFGNSTIMLLKSMDLFNEYSFIVNLEQKSYLDLILLSKLLDELKKEISNQGSTITTKIKNNFSKIQMINIGDLKKMEKSIESVKSSMQIENQAHDSMMLALNKEILSYVNKFNELEECYNSSIEKFQIKLDKIKSQCDLQKEKIRNLKDDYDYKLNIVLNYREEKNEEENFTKASKLISNWTFPLHLSVLEISFD